MRDHGNGTALLFGRTDTAAWQDLVLPYALALLLMRGRIKFCREDGSPAGTANAPSILVAYGEKDAQALVDNRIPGFYMSKGMWGTLGS